MTAALPLILSLPREGVGADVAKRRFHRIRLAGAGRFVTACVAAIPALAAWRSARRTGLAKARARAGIASTRATPFCAGATPVVVTRITALFITRLASWLARIGTVNAHVGTRLGAAYRMRQRLNIGFIQFDKRTALEAARQHHRTVANTNQAAHRMADSLKHAPDLAIASF